ncbi:MAG: acyl-CoA/acyl-ACP dehydrogenase [Nitrospirae bacterium]|nr:acyl-CoA/acyl-ACP dehydrogenase [Nitrospirota bacterium]
MQSLEIPPKLQNFVEMTRWLGKEHLRPLGIAADRQGHPHPPDHPFYKMIAEMGFMARRLDEETPVDDRSKEGKERWAIRTAVLSAEEGSFWDRGMAVSLPGPGLGGPPILQIGTPEQKERFLGIFRDKSKPRWGAFGMTEPGAGSDVARIATRCEKKGEGWVLNGEKSFCSNSPRADWVVVYATVDRTQGRAGHRAFVLEKGTPGFSTPKLEKKMGLVSYETATFSLSDCRIPGENLLGGEAAYQGNAGFVSAMKSFDMSRPIIAAMAVGIGRAAYEYARDFVKQNYMTGRPIPRYHRVLDRLATMKRRIEVAKLMCWKAAWMADLREPNTLMASMAKAYSAPVCLEACTFALEIVGEAGVSKDYLAEKLFRDAKAMDIVEGTGQIQRIVIARRLVDYPKAEQGG